MLSECPRLTSKSQIGKFILITRSKQTVSRYRMLSKPQVCTQDLSKVCRQTDPIQSGKYGSYIIFHQHALKSDKCMIAPEGTRSEDIIFDLISKNLHILSNPYGIVIRGDLAENDCLLLHIPERMLTRNAAQGCLHSLSPTD
jgi:hypothetical protein